MRARSNASTSGWPGLLAAMIVVACVASTPSVRAATPSFTGLGYPPSGAPSSEATGVSADGAVVVGNAMTDSGYHGPFRWTAATGMQMLSGQLGAGGVSGNGTALVGGPTGTIGTAFRWTPSGGYTYLGSLDTFQPFSFANAASGDGSLVVGRTKYLLNPVDPAAGFGYQPFRWTSAGGMVGLGHVPGPPAPGGQIPSGTAFDVSADGSVIVGTSRRFASVSSIRNVAFRWTQLDGMQVILDAESRAHGVSDDGTTIVGERENGFTSEAFRWTAEGGLQMLGDIAGLDVDSGAHAVSGDGGTIVGYGRSASGTEASLWTSAAGMRSLKEILVTDCGLDLTGWTLHVATGVSADGLTIVGRGTNPSGRPEAWIATIPEPAAAGMATVVALVLIPRRQRREHRLARGTRRRRPAMRSPLGFTSTSGSRGSPAAIIFAVALLAMSPPVASRAASFQGLGDLPGGSFISEANGITADGSTVVGLGRIESGWHAFRWTSAGGMQGLGDLPGSVFGSNARGVSADGLTVVGHSLPSSGLSAFRWTGSSGMVWLGSLSGEGLTATAAAASGDGSKIVGQAAFGSEGQAFMWTSVGGMHGLGFLGGFTPFSYAMGISRDGSTVVGSSSSVSGVQAFRWTSTGGMQGLGDLPGGSFESVANGVNHDGSIIVGNSRSGPADLIGLEAFLWTSGGGMQGLGDLSGGQNQSLAFAVSDDGSIVVGEGWSASGREAFIWTGDDGMRGLRDVLTTDYALDLSGWQLRRATGISADGSFICGYGINPSGQREAWIATIPEPASLWAIALICYLLPRHGPATHEEAERVYYDVVLYRLTPASRAHRM